MKEIVDRMLKLTDTRWAELLEAIGRLESSLPSLEVEPLDPAASLPVQVDHFNMAIFQELRELRQRKENDYGSSWRRKGAKGLLVRMGDKMERLDSLLWRDTQSQVLDEKIEDTARDLINYGFFLLFCLAEGNLTGPA